VLPIHVAVKGCLLDLHIVLISLPYSWMNCRKIDGITVTGQKLITKKILKKFNAEVNYKKNNFSHLYEPTFDHVTLINGTVC